MRFPGAQAGVCGEPEGPRDAMQASLRVHIWICVLIVAVTATTVLRPEWLTHLPLRCVMRNLLGVRCPFCGMTTDFIAMWHGHMALANPFSPLAALVIYVVYPAALVYTVRIKQPELFSHPRVRVAVLAMLFVMWLGNNLAR